MRDDTTVARPTPIATHLSAAIRRSAARPPNPLLDLAGQLADVIRLSRGDPDLPTPAHIVAAGKRALDEGYTHYTPVNGLPELCQAIAEKLAHQNGVEFDPDREILVTTGAQEAVFLTMAALLDPGDEILVPDPHYTSYDLAAEAVGGRVVPVPTSIGDAYVVRPEEIERRITPRTKALAVISPHNPTGTVYPLETLQQLAAIAERHDLIVIADEIYELLTFGENRHVSFAALSGMKERTITINGFSKAYAMTGWRVGYIAAPTDFIAAIGALRHTLTICAPAFAQKAAVAALTGPQDCVRDLVRIYAERQQFFIKGLRAIGLDAFEPRATFYVWVDLRATGLRSSEFCERLLREARVLIYPGSQFGQAGEGFARASLTVPVERLAEAIDRMAEAKVIRQLHQEAMS